MLGERVSLRKVSNRLVVSTRRKRKPGKVTDKLQAAQERFQEATQYARRQIAKPEAKALYTKGITRKGQSAFVIAVSDYLKAPRVSVMEPVRYNGSAGSVILIKAIDDFMVTKVEVTLRDAAGAVIEEGEARLGDLNDHQWEYTTKVDHPVVAGTTIRAVAYDRPGNTGTAEMVL